MAVPRSGRCGCGDGCWLGGGEYQLCVFSPQQRRPEKYTGFSVSILNINMSSITDRNELFEIAGGIKGISWLIKTVKLFLTIDYS